MTPLASIIADIGISQAEFARRYQLSRKSVSAWCQPIPPNGHGRRMSPGYRLMLKNALRHAYPDRDYAGRL